MRATTLLFCLLVAAAPEMGSAASENAGAIGNAIRRMDAAGTGSDPVIEFKPGALLMTPTYSLRDIAAVAHPDPRVRERLLDIELGLTPRPGQFTRVTRPGVVARIERELPGVAPRIEWQGKAFVRVQGGGVAGDGAAIERSAQRRLMSWLRQHYEEAIELRRVGGQDSLVIPRGQVTYLPRIGARRPGPRMVVWVDVRVDGRLFQTVPVWFAVSVFAPVAVVVKVVEKHRALPLDKVAVKRYDIAGLAGTPLPVEGLAQALAGKRATHKLAAGAVITDGDLESIPPVSRGEWITVYASQGSVTLAVRGRALGDGELRQPIMVENPGSGESYAARVIGKGLARVE